MKGRERKFLIEKVLHEYIRDLPEVKRMSEMFQSGNLTFEDALEEIAYVIRKERE